MLAQGTKLRVRSDSAGYRLDVMEYCLKHGMEFSITADLDCGDKCARAHLPRWAAAKNSPGERCDRLGIENITYILDTSG